MKYIGFFYENLLSFVKVLKIIFSPAVYMIPSKARQVEVKVGNEMSKR